MTNAPAPSRSTPLQQLAEGIRVEHEAATKAAQSAVEHAIRAGALLAEAKAQVKHGQWLPWLHENFPASRQTAAAYMRVAAKWKGSVHLPPSIDAALRELSAPDIASLPRETESKEGRPGRTLEENEATIEKGLHVAESEGLDLRPGLALEMASDKPNMTRGMAACRVASRADVDRFIATFGLREEGRLILQAVAQTWYRCPDASGLDKIRTWCDVVGTEPLIEWFPLDARPYVGYVWLGMLDREATTGTVSIPWSAYCAFHGGPVGKAVMNDFETTVDR